METKITRIDECEGKIELSGAIYFSWEQKTALVKALQEIIDEYAI